ncbi:hypothetical protein RUM44_001727 [Polyplax serrata]|uniref:Uncharacterized protein n=1 Tax=Polyplax serrata TaxID=468196 RepID=A0ABR1AKX7_POLSC
MIDWFFSPTNRIVHRKVRILLSEFFVAGAIQKILLHLARSIFEEQSNLECLVTKIMREARDLLKCERCAVYLLDLESCSEEEVRRTPIESDISRVPTRHRGVVKVKLQEDTKGSMDDSRPIDNVILET